MATLLHGAYDAIKNEFHPAPKFYFEAARWVEGTFLRRKIFTQLEMPELRLNCWISTSSKS